MILNYFHFYTDNVRQRAVLGGSSVCYPHICSLYVIHSLLYLFKIAIYGTDQYLYQILLLTINRQFHYQNTCQVVYSRLIR